MGKSANKALSLKLAPKRSSFNKALSFRHKSVDEVQQLAMYLSDKLHDEQSMKFYLKCAWHLSSDYLVDLADRSPSKWYFYAAASRELNA